jgi:hypothetical protein
LHNDKRAICGKVADVFGCDTSIVRLDRIKGYNQVNLSLGYGILTIVSPKEVQFDG